MSKITKLKDSFKNKDFVNIISFIFSAVVFIVLFFIEVSSEQNYESMLKLIFISMIIYILVLFVILESVKILTKSLKVFKWIYVVLLLVYTCFTLILNIKVVGSFDFTEASSIDYLFLEGRITIANSKEKLFLYATSFETFSDGTILANFESDECSIEVKYDENFNICSKNYVDNKYPYSLAIGALILIELGLVFIFVFVYSLIGYIFRAIYIGVKRIMSKS